MPTIQESLDTLVANSNGLVADVTGRLSDFDTRIATAASHESAANVAKAGAETAKSAAENALSGSNAAKDLSEAARDVSISNKTDSETAKSQSVAAQNSSIAAKNASISAQNSSVSAQQASETARNSSIAAKTGSETAKAESEAARDTALAYRNTANTHKNAASDSAFEATAKAEISGIYSNNANDSKDQAEFAKFEANTYKDQAGSSAANAATSESNALSYRNTANTHKNAASTSEANANSYKNSSASSASAAASSASAASVSATNAVNAVINNAPANLNTLNELAAALGDDANFAGSVTASIATKVAKNSTQALSTASNALTISGHTITLHRGNGSTDVVTVPDNNTNTHRAITNSLTSTSTSTSLSAEGGRQLKNLVDGKAASSHSHNYAAASHSHSGATYSTLYVTDWIRPKGDSGLYFQDKGTGLRSVQSEGGQYGSVATYSGIGGWEGYSINGQFVFMGNGTNTGIYNDIDNEWMIHATRNGSCEIRHNNVTKGTATSGGWSVNGNLENATEIYHGGWVRANGTTAGHYWSANGWHMYSKDADDFYMRAGSGSCGIALTVSNTTARGYVYANTSNEIGFLNSARSWAFRVDNNKNAYAWGNVTAYSDKRHKKDISTIDGGLEKVNKLRGVYFTKIDTDQKGSGVIAQELQEVMPELVLTDKKGELSVAYGNITGVLIEAIKELTAKVEALENKGK